MQIFIKSSLFILLLCWQGLVSAAELPPGWPWRGVNMDNLSSQPDDLKRYKKALNINAVRLQIKVQKYGKREKVSVERAWQDSIAWADTMLDSCAALGIHAIVNVSSFPLDPKVDLIQTDPLFWKNDQHLADVVMVADRISKIFQNRGEELIAYEFMSEPVIVERGKSRKPEEWEKLLVKIVKELKQNDPLRWVVVAPGPWGGPDGYDDFELLNATHIIYGVHTYMPHTFTHQGIRGTKLGAVYPGRVGLGYWNKKELAKSLSPLRSFEQKHQVPVLVGEFSAVRWAEGGEQYIKDLADIFDGYGWSWLYFSGTGWQGWNPDFNQDFALKRTDWEKDYVGEKSVRWQTLREIFHVTKDKLQP